MVFLTFLLDDVRIQTDPGGPNPIDPDLRTILPVSIIFKKPF